jgi:hypothetical protein
LVGVNGDADALGPGVFGVGLGAVTETNENRKTICSLSRTRTHKEKKAVLVSVWLKKVIKEYDTYKLNKYNIIINHV